MNMFGSSNPQQLFVVCSDRCSLMFICTKSRSGRSWSLASSFITRQANESAPENQNWAVESIAPTCNHDFFKLRQWRWWLNVAVSWRGWSQESRWQSWNKFSKQRLMVALVRRWSAKLDASVLAHNFHRSWKLHLYGRRCMHGITSKVKLFKTETHACHLKESRVMYPLYCTVITDGWFDDSLGNVQKLARNTNVLDWSSIAHH